MCHFNLVRLGVPVLWQKKSPAQSTGLMVGPEFPSPDVFDVPMTSLSKWIAVIHFENLEASRRALDPWSVKSK